MFEYEVIPVQVTRGAAGRVADEEWAALRSELNERGRKGFRVVAVSDGAEGRAIIMERPLKEALAADELTAVSVAEAAEEITRESVVGEPHTPDSMGGAATPANRANHRPSSGTTSAPSLWW